MLMTDFLNAMQSIFLLRLKFEPSAAATLMSNNSSRLELMFHEGYAPLEAVSVLVGKELSENFDAKTGAPIATQLMIDPKTGEPYVQRVS
jgi:hypothetical protein